MATVFRMRVTWSGGPVVGPGVTTLYAMDGTATGWPAATLALFTALRTYIPTGATIDVPSTVDIIDVFTGDLIGTATPGGGGSTTSIGGSGDYKPGTGLRIRWGTNGVVGGRRVTGTTFVCPVMGTDIPNGQAAPATKSGILAAANAYIAAAGFAPAVYSPKVANDPDPKGRNRPGAVSEILNANVPSAMTWLRSRRT